MLIPSDSLIHEDSVGASSGLLMVSTHENRFSTAIIEF
jgi:hypothetical protein